MRWCPVHCGQSTTNAAPWVARSPIHRAYRLGARQLGCLGYYRWIRQEDNLVAYKRLCYHLQKDNYVTEQTKIVTNGCLLTCIVLRKFYTQ
ncbi:hypothetical protein DPMN_171307 [Dreissena polymorpha]|uniref:Uncharacterized protein n=1 Tax=Dreissena polymorpha TaxID=45954 RepID=A0A9D4IFG1_DREPO|nr:hypothetical protein DPMN_171307 [Dreissena polymorpha]